MCGYRPWGNIYVKSFPSWRCVCEQDESLILNLSLSMLFLLGKLILSIDGLIFTPLGNDACLGIITKHERICDSPVSYIIPNKSVLLFWCWSRADFRYQLSVSLYADILSSSEFLSIALTFFPMTFSCKQISNIALAQNYTLFCTCEATPTFLVIFCIVYKSSSNNNSLVFLQLW